MAVPAALPVKAFPIAPPPPPAPSAWQGGDHGRTPPGCGAGQRDLAAVAAIAAIAQPLVLEQGRVLFEEGDAASFVHFVVDGMVRVQKTLPDGRRQIVDFRTAGDALGLMHGTDHHHCAAETVIASTVQRVTRSRLDALMDEHPGVCRHMMQATATRLAAAQDRMLLLGRKTARERLCCFFMELAERRERSRGEGGRIHLPMGRDDIADYLGLTVETVSRTISRLRADGVIRLVEASRIELADRARLAACGAGR